jgi:hypothetical protein
MFPVFVAVGIWGVKFYMNLSVDCLLTVSALVSSLEGSRFVWGDAYLLVPRVTFFLWP